LTASQDGKLLLWDALTKNKLHMISLNGPWVVTCAISPSGNIAAAGGFDNFCGFYSIPVDENAMPRLIQVLPHNEYISCVRFIDEQTAVTSCGDKNIRVWDVETGKCRHVLSGHQGAVSTVASFDRSLTLLSGSFDQTAKVWDARTPNTCRTFLCHEGDVNAAEWYPDGNAIATGGDDGLCRVFDLRQGSDMHLAAIKSQPENGVKSLAFSNTGQVLFAGYEDGIIYGWDLQKQEIIHTLADHTCQVTGLDVSADGTNLASGSFDSSVTIWS